MKIRLQLTLAALILFQMSNAQELGKHQESPFYLRGGVGYGLPHAGNTSIAGSYTQSGNLQTTKSKRASFGAGAYAAVAAGYQLSNHIAVEIGVTIGVLGQKFDYTNTTSASGPGSTTAKNTSYAEFPVYVVPALVLQTGGDVNFYTRIGAVVNVAGKVLDKNESTTVSGTARSTSTSTQEYKFQSGLGFQGAAGVSYPVAPKIQLYAEVTGISLNLYVKQSEYTAFTINGKDALSTMTTYDKKTVFEKEISTVTGSSVSPSQPKKELEYALPFSNAGLMAGVIFKL